MFPYASLGFVRPVSVSGGHAIIYTCATAAVFQLVGLGTAVATPVLWFTFSWLFNICESNHNNHYLLMCHLLFIGSFIGWGRWMSLDQLILAKLGCDLLPLMVAMLACVPNPAVVPWLLNFLGLVLRHAHVHSSKGGVVTQGSLNGICLQCGYAFPYLTFSELSLRHGINRT